MYDICPQTRTGFEASQAMLISGNDRMSRVSSCLEAAPQFLLPAKEAIAIAETLLTAIITHSRTVCDQARLSPVDRRYLWGRQFLNPYAFENLDGDAASLRRLADDALP